MSCHYHCTAEPLGTSTGNTEGPAISIFAGPASIGISHSNLHILLQSNFDNLNQCPKMAIYVLHLVSRVREIFLAEVLGKKLKRLAHKPIQFWTLLRDGGHSKC